MPLRVFPSLAREERDLLDLLVPRLESRELQVFNTDEIRLGFPFDNVIQEAILDSNSVVPFLSGAATRSHYVQAEVWLAHFFQRNFGRPALLPLALRGFDVSTLTGPISVIMGLQWIRWEEESLDRIAKRIHEETIRCGRRPRPTCPDAPHVDDAFSSAIRNAGSAGVAVVEYTRLGESKDDIVAVRFEALWSSLDELGGSIREVANRDPDRATQSRCLDYVRRAGEVPQEITGLAPPAVKLEPYLRELTIRARLVLRGLKEELTEPRVGPRKMSQSDVEDYDLADLELPDGAPNRYADFDWLVRVALAQPVELANYLQSMRDLDVEKIPAIARRVLDILFYNLDFLQHPAFWDPITQGRLVSNLHFESVHGPLVQKVSICLDQGTDGRVEPWERIASTIKSAAKSRGEREIAHRSIALNHPHLETRRHALGGLPKNALWDLYSIARVPRSLHDVAASLADSAESLKLLADVRLSGLGHSPLSSDLPWLQKYSLLFSRSTELMDDPRRRQVIADFVARVRRRTPRDNRDVDGFAEFHERLNGPAARSEPPRPLTDWLDGGVTLDELLLAAFDGSGVRSKTNFALEGPTGRYASPILSGADKDLLTFFLSKLSSPAEAQQAMTWRGACSDAITSILFRPGLRHDRGVRIDALSHPRCPGTVVAAARPNSSEKREILRRHSTNTAVRDAIRLAQWRRRP